MQAQYGFGSNFGSFGGLYGGLYGGYDRSCPIDLIYSLSSIVQTLYGYGQPLPDYSWAGYGAQNFNPAFGYAGYASGRQTTTPTTPNNPFNPACPWNLINGMIQQIAQYVDQMQRSSPVTNTVTPNAQAFAGNTGGPFGMMGGLRGMTMARGPFGKK